MTVRGTQAASYVLAIIGVIVLGTLVVAQLNPARKPSAAAPEGPAVSGTLDAATFREIAGAQMPMVVSISTLREAETPAVASFGGPDALRRFFGLPGLPPMPETRILQGAGSGFIIDSDGLVLTNNHVVQDATRIQVVLFPDPQARPGDVRRLDAKVLGRDPFTDSALLQVDAASDLPVATLGNSDAMRPGDWVMAIGNPFALSHTVTIGVISATERPFPVEGRPQRVLQTDAAINPGNSGGPLLNLRGEVVGVNTAIFSPGATGGNVGIGFAIPVNTIASLIPQLRKGDVHRGRLGVEIRAVPEGAAAALGLKEAEGALVSTVEPDGPADTAGVEPGDVIVEFNGEAVDRPDTLVARVSNAAPGTEVPVTVVREGERQNLTVTLGELTPSGSPDEPANAGAADRFGMTLGAVPPAAARELGLSPGEGGGVVTEVMPGSPASEAGVQPGDVILEVNREPAASLSATVDRLGAVGPGESAFLLVLREGRRVFLVLTRPA